MKREECKGYFQISCCNCFCLRHYLIIIYAKVKVTEQLFIFASAKIEAAAKSIKILQAI